MGPGWAAVVVGGMAGGGGGQAEVREVLKAADMFQAEGLLKHCLEAFGKGLTVGTAVEGLVWAHGSGPEAARRVAEAYVVAQARAIQELAGDGC